MRPEYLIRAARATALAAASTFVGFGIVGASDALMSGVSWGSALTTFVVYGLVGAVLAAMTTQLLLLTNRFLSRESLPHQVGLS